MQKILVIDDEKNIALLIKQFLVSLGYDVETAHNGKDGMQLFTSRPIDTVICDFQLPDMTGLDVLTEVRRSGVPCSFIIITAHGTIERAFEASRMGADFFIKKPFDLHEIQICLEKLDTEIGLKNELSHFQTRDRVLSSTDNIIGISEPVKKIKKQICDIARFNTSVLITGESGTGKELVARALHNSGSVHDKPFIAVNCSAIPEALIESEFFGYLRGAFTGAFANKKGLFEEADGSVLFLDEIGDLPLQMQAKILRALQEKKIRRVGDTKEISVDVRLISATSKDLTAMIKEGSFREDLYYRINIINLHIPPLRERPEDIPILTRHFLDKLSKKTGLKELLFSDDALNTLRTYPFPGNIRELENIVERAVILNNGRIVTQDDLLTSLPHQEHKSGFRAEIGDLTLPYKEAMEKIHNDFDRQYIISALQRNGNNRQKTADSLGISLRLLQSKISIFLPKIGPRQLSE